MSPRNGRPKAENPLIIEVKARIDEKTSERLKAYCEKFNLSKTEVIRTGIEKVLEEKESAE